MPTAFESKAAAERVADAAVNEAVTVLEKINGTPEARRATLLEVVPEVIGYYALGTAALGADFYDERRELAGVASGFTATATISDRVVKTRRGIAWAAEPLFTDDFDTSLARLREIVGSETIRPYRDTILVARKEDPESVGWKRITSPGACGFCLLLADKGAIYKQETARFAAHTSCMCTAAPVFRTQTGPEASVLQYAASRRTRTPAEKEDIRWWVQEYESRGPNWYSEQRALEFASL